MVYNINLEVHRGGWVGVFLYLVLTYFRNYRKVIMIGIVRVWISIIRADNWFSSVAFSTSVQVHPYCGSCPSQRESVTLTRPLAKGHIGSDHWSGWWWTGQAPHSQCPSLSTQNEPFYQLIYWLRLLWRAGQVEWLTSYRSKVKWQGLFTGKKSSIHDHHKSWLESIRWWLASTQEMCLMNFVK